MRERLQRSTFTVALSLAAITIPLHFAAPSCHAGDKIEFSTPGDPAIIEKPEALLPDDDSASGGLKNASLTRRYEVQDPGATIIIPGADDKHRGLRAWDAASNSDDSRDSDDSLGRPPQSSQKSGLTNQFNRESDWILNSETPRFGNSSFSAPGSPNDPARSAYGAKGQEAFSPFGKTDQNALELPSLATSGSVWHGEAIATSGSARFSNPLTATAAGVGLSAWNSLEVTPASSSESFTERFKDIYKSGRTAGAPDSELGNPAAAGSFSSSSTVGVGGSVVFTSSAIDRTGPWIKDPDSGDDGAIRDAQRGGYRAYQTPMAGPVAPRTPATPSMAGSGYTSSDLNLVNQRFAEHPAILALPKKPGALVQ